MPRYNELPTKEKLDEYLTRSNNIKIIFADGNVCFINKCNATIGYKWRSYYWDDKFVEIVEMDEEKTYAIVEEVKNI